MREAELELGAGQARGHRVARQIALREHQIAGTDAALVARRAAPVAASAGAADEQNAHAGFPQDPERLPLAGAEQGILVVDLTVGRNAQELAPARPPIVLPLWAEPVRRARPADAVLFVAPRRSELVEPVAEAPRRTSAERREGGAGASIFLARVETAEASGPSGAHRGSVGDAGAEVKGNLPRLDSLRKPAKVLGGSIGVSRRSVHEQETDERGSDTPPHARSIGSGARRAGDGRRRSLGSASRAGSHDGRDVPAGLDHEQRADRRGGGAKPRILRGGADQSEDHAGRPERRRRRDRGLGLRPGGESLVEPIADAGAGPGA